MRTLDRPGWPPPLPGSLRVRAGAVPRSTWPFSLHPGATPERRSWRPLLRLSFLLLALVSPAPAFDRVQALLQPGPDRRDVTHINETQEAVPVPGLVIRGDTLVACLPESNWVIEYSLLDGKARVLAGAADLNSKGPVHPEDALATPLYGPQAICLAPDGALLVADRKSRILRLQPGGPGQPTTVSEIAEWRRTGEITNTLLEGHGVASTVLACRDGSVLVGTMDTGGFARFRDGKSSFVPGLPYPLGRNPLFLERADGSIRASSLDRMSILRAATDGTSSVYAGGAEAKPGLGFARDGWPIYGMCLGRDQSVLVTIAHLGEVAVLRIREGGINLVAGPQPATRLTQEANYFPEVPKGLYSLKGELADGTLVFAGRTGITLISPADALQTILEQLVERGRAALKEGRAADWQAVDQELRLLAQPLEATLATVSKEGGQGGITPDKGPALSKELLQHIAGFTNGPLERFRALLALRELRALQKARAAGNH